jgi:alpha-1,3-rhamnosyl/mannosyltransferase
MPSTAGAVLEVDPTDVKAIGAAMVAASTEEACRSQLLDAGKARAAQLTWKEAARAHVELWSALA